MSEPVQPRARDRALRIGVVVVLAVLPLVVRVAWEASAEMSAAAAAREAGDEETEVIHLGRALRWRLPLASHDEHAIARLLEIGETADDPARALVAYREIRSGLLGSRALDLPHADTLHDVDARIATIMAAGDADAEAVRLAELRVASDDSRVGKAVAALAWIAWVVASARFLMHGIDARGRLVPGVGTRSGLLALALLVGWMIAWRLA
jgi:hypothetical protein